MQIYLISLVTFSYPNNRSSGMGTALLLVHHAYYTNVTRTLVVADCCLA